MAKSKAQQDWESARCNAATKGTPYENIYGKEVQIFPVKDGKQTTKNDRKIYLPELLPLEDYDKIILLFSGGKDSLDCYLSLLEMGVPKERIELFHHDIDGGHPLRTMDWPVTRNYITSVAEQQEVFLRFSWRQYGFFGELYRIGASHPIQYEDEREIRTCRLSPRQIASEEIREKILHKLATEEDLKQYGCVMKFPAKQSIANGRWCSAVLKGMVGDAVIRDMDYTKEEPGFLSHMADTPIGDDIRELEALGIRGRLPAKQSCQRGRWCTSILKAKVENAVTTNLEKWADNVKLLVISGERREESRARATLNEMEIHRTNANKRKNRLVHLWRLAIDHTETAVWNRIRRHRIAPHPCYPCGWNRCSCMACIFSKKSQWAGIRELFPDVYYGLVEDEYKLGFTLNIGCTLEEYVGDTKSCVCRNNPIALEQLTTGHFTPDDVIVDDWRLPTGAFQGAGGGPC